MDQEGRIYMKWENMEVAEIATSPGIQIGQRVLGSI
jgi:hypothetical protein